MELIPNAVAIIMALSLSFNLFAVKEIEDHVVLHVTDIAA
jgi:hypothetical protein